MRTIKFRLRIKGEKGFTYVDLKDFLEDYGLSEQLCLVKVLSVDQYTGLKDKKGKEIYEGDIVKTIVDSGTEQFPHESELIELVEFMGGCFYPICNEPPKNFEVIGNIYENKEHLK